MVGSARRWWQQADQFDWFSAYIRDRGLQTQWRTVTVAFAASLMAVPVVLIASPTGPDHPLTIAVSVLASLCGAASGSLWLIRWPTRRQSVLFTVGACAAIAATCLSQSDPYATLMGCTTFAIIGGFVAYFHTAGLVAAIFGTSVVCATVGMVRLIASTGDLALATSAFVIVLALNLGVPFGIYTLAHALRSDLRSSGHDPLTGLLNRGAFYQSAHELVMQHPGGRDVHLVVALIDLDDFKSLNDTQGHAVGDEALVGVGAALRESCLTTAVIGRIGGEEFVVAELGIAAAPAVMAEKIRKAVADIPFPITASIGTASAPLTGAGTADFDFVDRLVRTADAAMYDAKRAGGDRVSHRSELVLGDQVRQGPGR
ncbi:GGDEF domain-containing protein [Mycolicibacterium mengxianglii]|uniref:GGDEF domain-containing protein n=1 Tax=Mycolicibacterium mengxianglii TaxID=2736649 RepID=UPI0018D1AA30|nr:GGDEF domain-containing protein [Mycolicibacterium mengxianglii]